MILINNFFVVKKNYYKFNHRDRVFIINLYRYYKSNNCLKSLLHKFNDENDVKICYDNYNN